LVRHSDLAPGEGRPWRAPLGPTSALSSHLQAIAPLLGSAGNRSTQVFRVEFPPGFDASDLVQAVGGGFRGTVRVGGDAGRIGGQVRLLPGHPMMRPALVGPMLGLMAVTVLAEMAAAAEQDRKLTAILTTVERLDARLRMQSDARLRTAEQAIRQAHAALLDRAVIPESIGLGAAMSHVQDIHHMSIALLAGWERVADKRCDTDVPGSVLRKELGKVGDVGWDGFVDAVRTAHLANHLDSRRLMLVASEAEFRNPGSPLRHLRQAVENDLAERSRDLARLRALLSRLSGTPLTISTWDAGVLPHLITDKALENARTQALFAGLTAAVGGAMEPSWNPSGFDAELGHDGEVRILAPASGT
jgi:hypothetical protein